MKKQSFALGRRIRFMAMGLFVSMGAAFVSCSEDDKEELVNKDPFMMEIEVPAAGETKDVTVEAVGNWKLSTTNSSMIKINSSLVGSAGNVKIEFTVNANNSFASRTAELNFSDSRNNVIKVIQAGANPDMNFSKPVAVTYDAEKGLFTDTVVVTSNLAWELPELPEWIDEMKIIKGQPQAGSMTDVTLVVVAKQDMLKAAGNNAQVVLARKNDQDFTMDVSYAGYTPKIEFDLPNVTFEQNILNSRELHGSVTITSNVKWTLDQVAVSWLDPVVINNTSMNGVETSVKVWFTMPAAIREVEGMNGTVQVADANSDFKQPLLIVVPAVTDSYFLVKADNMSMADDNMFDAQEGEGAYMSDIISVYAKDPNGVTPFLFIMENGRPKIVNYPRIGEINKVAPATRALMDHVDWELIVYPRSESEEYMGMNPYGERMGAVVFFANSELNQYGDLPDEYLEDNWTYLKPEYFKNEVMFRQKGLTAAQPVFNLFEVTDGGSLTLKSNGGSEYYFYEANFNIEREGIFTMPMEIDWCEIYFDTEQGRVEFKTKPNTTGKARNQKVEFLHGVSNELLFTVTLVQQAN